MQSGRRKIKAFNPCMAITTITAPDWMTGKGSKINMQKHALGGIARRNKAGHVCPEPRHGQLQHAARSGRHLRAGDHVACRRVGEDCREALARGPASRYAECEWRRRQDGGDRGVAGIRVVRILQPEDKGLRLAAITMPHASQQPHLRSNLKIKTNK